MSKSKIPVGVLGATGVVGQQYLRLLAQHPWFEVSFLAASKRSAGKTYKEAVSGRWHLAEPLDPLLARMPVHSIEEVDKAAASSEFVFSALDSDVAREWEESYAGAGLGVLSNASAHRKTPDVPILLPEINEGHLEILKDQQKARGWNKGFILVKPNCSIQSYLLPLYALHKEISLKKVLVTTLQAVSGAGHPGVSSLDIVDNVIPLIPGEEEKTEWEPLKILGRLENGKIQLAENISISAHCNRVGVVDGHLACVSFELDGHLEQDEILRLWREFPPLEGLPLAPRFPICYHAEPDRPQPRKDRDVLRGMSVHVGRLRPCPVLQYRFVGLSHNTARGAAGGGVLNAELMAKHLGLL